ncbi:MAG: transketolase [Planctomycetaceae bacterium]|nr:transketolase [Planctomycetaceae bacterium]
MSTNSKIDQLAINTIRTLSMDAVQKANSGHPGTPMALAPVAYTLYTQFLNYDPASPQWPGRDRFVLSCGHASMLLYSLIHLSGIKKANGQASVTLDDIKNFRQLHSPCAGHPEFGYAEGIETTTGPLGQGIANSVGMAIAARHLGARYDRGDLQLFDYNVYALCGDGCLMEGVGCEAASLAGHLQLSNLCWIYDDNKITIEGHSDLAYSEDVPAKYRACGWNVQIVEDANDLRALQAAFAAFEACQDRPTLIIVRSVIGYGAPNKQNTHDAHGAPLGAEEIKLAKSFYGWPTDAQFLVPPEVQPHFQSTMGTRGTQAHAEWQAKWERYQELYPKEAAELQCIMSGTLPSDWTGKLPRFEASAKGDATRNSSGKVIHALSASIPHFIGGSADLAGSNKTDVKGAGSFLPPTPAGKNFHFGVREHVMAAILNGMALSGIRPYGGTFFAFTDYMRGAMRLSSLMHLNVIYVLTHDSIGLGEDGPTHQPVEHLAACRAIPGLIVLRPGDANEVSFAYQAALENHRYPTAMILSRQNVPTLDRSIFASAEGTLRGGYVLSDCAETPQVILIGTGTELPICVKAAETLTAEGIRVRVVSMPSWELFDQQDDAYRNSVLPETVTARVACEAGIKQGWERYLGFKGAFIGMKSFGASAPFEQLYEHFGITPAAVVAAAKQQIGLA